MNYLFVFDSGMSSMADLMIVSSYYLGADSPLLHCVFMCQCGCVHFHVCLLAVYGGGGGGGGGGVRWDKLCIHIKYIFFSLEN